MRQGTQPRPWREDSIAAHSAIYRFTPFYLFQALTSMAAAAGISRSFAQQRAAERGVVLQPHRQSVTKASAGRGRARARHTHGKKREFQPSTPHPQHTTPPRGKYRAVWQQQILPAARHLTHTRGAQVSVACCTRAAHHTTPHHTTPHHIAAPSRSAHAGEHVCDLWSSRRARQVWAGMSVRDSCYVQCSRAGGDGRWPHPCPCPCPCP